MAKRRSQGESVHVWTRYMAEPSEAHTMVMGDNKSALYEDSIRHFARNGVWGHCGSCPSNIGGDRRSPEWCRSANQPDHQRTLEDLLKTYKSLHALARSQQEAAIQPQPFDNNVREVEHLELMNPPALEALLKEGVTDDIWLTEAFRLADSRSESSHVKHQVSNCVARVVMGWSLRDGDERRVWRTSDGLPVQFASKDLGGHKYTLRAHTSSRLKEYHHDWYFSPGTNYNPGFVADWRAVAWARVRHTRLAAPQMNQDV